MGGGSWTADTHASRANTKAVTGVPDFAHTATTRASHVSTWAVHEDLDPKKVNTDASVMHAGQNIRESLDSDEHPTSVAVAVLFDETGSMGMVPRQLLGKLPELFSLLLRKGYLEHPQVLFGGIGDAYSDRVPLQVGQFESDNRCDEDLEKIFLEGNGGGGGHESYELALYFMANHTYLDCVEKRGHKGYLFIIGDEMPYDTVNPKHVKDIIGDSLSVEGALRVEDVLRDAQEKYEVFLIRPDGGSYRPGTASGDAHIARWRSMLGERVIDLPDLDSVCETIGLMIGLTEGVLDDVDDGLSDLRELGVADETVRTVGRALAKVGSAGSGAIATSAAPAGLGEPDSVERV